jgi:outer membrane cobalamin receptor
MNLKQDKIWKFLVLMLVAQLGWGQDYVPADSVKIEQMDLKELMELESTGDATELEKEVNLKLNVASSKPLSSRKSPSIVTIITKEEIYKSGARDMIDLLRQVPGFDFGVDVTGTVGLGIRGNWSQEGKVLMLLDGQEMNETMYGTLQFGNEYNLAQIKRIEIIRGPGSAIYGGYAEYGVINIITKNGKETDGLKIYGIYGQMQKTYARRNAAIAYGKKIGNIDFTISLMAGQGNRSDRDYADVYGNSYNLAGNSSLNPTNLNIGLGYKNLKIRLIYDKYQGTVRDGFGGSISSKPYQNDFTSYFAEVKYDYKINRKWTITPKFNFKSQKPYEQSEKIAPVDYNFTRYKKISNRIRFNLTSSYDILPELNLISGGEIYFDNAKTDLYPYDTLFDQHRKGGQKVDYYNVAPFAQLLFKHKIANVTLGARYDWNSAFSSAFVPRIGITRSFGNLNLKALYSNSFRAPSIENISSNINLDQSKIKPELTSTIEIEAGIALTRNDYLTLSLFDIYTKNVILYTYRGEKEGYYNGSGSGTNGFELDYKNKNKWGYVNLGYSFYTAALKDNVLEYKASDAKLYAFANHKINVNASFSITKSLSINPSIVFYSARYGYEKVSADSIPQLKAFDPTLLFHMFINYDNFLTKGLSLGLGCYDILGQNYAFIQPYLSSSSSQSSYIHAPLPGTSREFTVRIIYQLGKNKP